MNDYKVSQISLNADEYSELDPQSYINFISNYSKKRSKTFVIHFNGNLMFICRLYYLSRQLKKDRDIPLDIDYELGDVFLFHEYRGKKDPNLNKKYSTICLETILNIAKSYGIRKIILYTTDDNLKAINLYLKLGFNIIQHTKKMENWIYDNIGRDYKFLLKHKFVFMDISI